MCHQNSPHWCQDGQEAMEASRRIAFALRHRLFQPEQHEAITVRIEGVLKRLAVFGEQVQDREEFVPGFEQAW
jgi:hypothetical protein